MNVTVACSSAVRADVAARDRPADVLGVSDAAVYLRPTGGRRVVVAVVTADAIRLPCALVLGSSSRNVPLTALRPTAGSRPTVGSGRISWRSTAGAVTLTIGTEWAPARPGTSRPRADLVRRLRSESRRFRHGTAEHALTALEHAARFGQDADAAHAAVGALLGAGPGLTPSGDDVLAGFVLAAGAFGLDVVAVRSLVDQLADERTTALSAQLLRHALEGDCIPELAALIRGVAGIGDLRRAAADLLRVGHTSGAALATGVAVAAAAAAPAQPRPMTSSG
jgi:hypothetical protein